MPVRAPAEVVRGVKVHADRNIHTSIIAAVEHVVDVVVAGLEPRPPIRVPHRRVVACTVLKTTRFSNFVHLSIARSSSGELLVRSGGVLVRSEHRLLTDSQLCTSKGIVLFCIGAARGFRCRVH